MGFFDFFTGMSEGSQVKTLGIVGDVVSGAYKSWQTMQYAEDQGDEYKRAGRANAKLAVENAKAAFTQAREVQRKGARDLTINYEKVNAVLAAQKASFADRGIVSSTGSAKAIRKETLHQGKVNAEVIYHDMKTDVQRLRDLENHYYNVAATDINEANYSAYLVERAAANRAGNLISESITSGVKKGYEVGVSEGWWGEPKKEGPKKNGPPKASTYYT
jgi:hypothetical protein